MDAKSPRKTSLKSRTKVPVATRRTDFRTGRTAGKGNPVRALREQLGFNRKSFSRLTGFSERAIAGWEADKPLSDVSRQRVLEISRLRQALANVMNGDFVGEWLNAPNPAFEGLKPLEVIERGEVDRLWRMIYQLESGMPG
jgi:hypothetical protein